MGPTLLEYAIDRDGRYVDASTRLLEVTGYTLEELRGLVVGQLSTQSPDVAREMWQRFVAGEYQVREVPVLVRRKDGRFVDAVLLSMDPAPDGSRWLVQLELVRLPSERPAREALTSTLADWRAAERRLLSLPDDDPLRPVVEAQVADLQNRYRELQSATLGIDL